MSPYRGITYPSILDREWVHRLWRKFMCPREIHLFDECYSPQSEEEKRLGFYEHYLSCDACGLIVEICNIETDEEFMKKIRKTCPEVFEEGDLCQN